MIHQIKEVLSRYLQIHISKVLFLGPYLQFLSKEDSHKPSISFTCHSKKSNLAILFQVSQCYERFTSKSSVIRSTDRGCNTQPLVISYSQHCISKSIFQLLQSLGTWICPFANRATTWFSNVCNCNTELFCPPSKLSNKTLCKPMNTYQIQYYWIEVRHTDLFLLQVKYSRQVSENKNLLPVILSESPFDNITFNTASRGIFGGIINSLVLK